MPEEEGLGAAEGQSDAASEELYIEPTEGAEGEAGGGDQSYTIDGRAYALSDLRNFIKGGMFERDYRIKTAELAEERKQMEGLQQAAQAWQYIEQDPKLLGLIVGELQKHIEGSLGPAAPAGEAPAELMSDERPWQQDISKLQNQLAGVLGTYDQQLQAYNQFLWQQWRTQREGWAKEQIPALERKYPWLDGQEIIGAFVNKRDATADDLVAFAKISHDYHYKQYQGKAKGELEKRKQNAKKQIETAGPGGSPAVATNQPKTYEDARASAMERLSALFANKGR